MRSDVVEGQFSQRRRLLGPRSLRASSRRAAHFILRSVTLRTRRRALVGCPDRLDFSLASMPSAVRCPPEGGQRLATCDRSLLLAKQLESCRTPLMGFVSQIALPSTSDMCVHSRFATVPARRGVQLTGHAVVPACAFSTTAASLRAFGPRLPIWDSFRPCRFSRLRRLAPHTQCRSVAPCSRS